MLGKDTSTFDEVSELRLLSFMTVVSDAASDALLQGQQSGTVRTYGFADNQMVFILC